MMDEKCLECPHCHISEDGYYLFCDYIEKGKKCLYEEVNRMKYKYEFELSNFEKGFCADCPLSHYNGYYYICPLGCDYKNCPLEEVEDD